MISPHAIIHPKAVLGKDVTIGPFTIIGENVEIGDNTKIGSHVVIQGPTKIGKHNNIYHFVSLGVECQDKKYRGEMTTLEVGDYNIFRESSTVHRGTINGNGKTSVGSNNLFMVNTHVAHDCIVGNNVIFSNGAAIAGHVVVEDHVNLSGFVGINQFCRIGAHSFAAGASIIIKDVMPFTIVAGHPARSCGVNVVGLTRSNFDPEVIALIKKAYKIIFTSSKTVSAALAQLQQLVSECPQIQQCIDFLQSSRRGILR